MKAEPTTKSYKINTSQYMIDFTNRKVSLNTKKEQMTRVGKEDLVLIQYLRL